MNIISLSVLTLIFVFNYTVAGVVSTDLKSDEGYHQTKISAPPVEVVSPYIDIDWDQVVLKKTAKHIGHPNKWDFNPSSSDVIKEMVRYGYKVFGMSMDFGGRNDKKMVWPWTELSERTDPEDPSEDVDPAELGVVAIPEVENVSPEREGIGVNHITVMLGDEVNVPGAYLSNREIMDMHPYDQMKYYENEMNSLTSLSHPCRWNHGKEHYIPFFDKTENLIGLSVFSKDSDRNQQTSLPLWDELLEHYADEDHIKRFVWGLAIDDATRYRIGFRTPGRHETMHQGLFNNWMSQIWYESEWDPVERQDQSRELARKKYKDGMFFFHRVKSWSDTAQQPEDIPDVPTITNIDIGRDYITIEAELYEEIRWVSNGKIVSTETTFEFNEDNIGSYVRAELETNEGSVTLTQPFYFVNPSPVRIIEPSQGSVIEFDSDINEIKISASISYFENGIDKVEFFVGEEKMGERFESPWEITWTAADAGDYTLTAIATGVHGETAVSKPVNVSVIFIQNIKDFIFVDSRTHEELMPIEDGMTAGLTELTGLSGNGFAIQVITDFSIGSVVYDLNGVKVIANGPNFIFDIDDLILAAGTHAITATPYSQADGQGVVFEPGILSVTFKTLPMILMQWVEAESAAGQENFSPLQSLPMSDRIGKYIMTGTGVRSTEAPPGDGQAFYVVDGQLDEGNIAIWMRIRYESMPDFSYWIRYNNEDFEELTTSLGYRNWQWIKWGEHEVSGSDTLRLAYRHAESKIDRLLFTNVLDFTPEGDGDDIPVSADDEEDRLASEVPSEYRLYQNYPNPFNPVTHISYNLPVQTPVQLTVYDITGRHVANLVDKIKNAGSYTVSFDASNLASGLYLYQLNTRGVSITRKMSLIK